MTTTDPDIRARVERARAKNKAAEAAYETTTIGELVSLRARTHADRIAIDIFDRGERVTYAEMDRMSNAYANALHAFGVRKGDRVGLMLPNRIEFPLLWFACAKLGAIIVPINMRYTPREVDYVLSDTEAKFAVVDPSAWPTFSAMDPWPKSLARQRVIVVGDSPDGQAVTMEALLRGAADTPPSADVTADDLLTIQYTSGTTGFPKGCTLMHDFFAVGAYVSTMRDVQPMERYLSTSPFFYIDGQAILLKSYRQGGTLFLSPQLSSSRFMEWLKKYRIDWVQMPELIARQQPDADDQSIALKRVHQFGGWSPESIRLFRKRFPGVGNNGYYGMTEIGIGTQYPEDFDEMIEQGALGLAAPFRELKVVNPEDGKPTPDGEIGELWAKGRGIMKGYWNKPEVNAEQFQDGWFRTGDLVRRNELGFYWLVGRTKDMIRRSSENIAAREVESVIREIADVAEVAAVPVKDAKRGEEVKIFVELREGAKRDDVAPERILAHARARLAPFKVPRYIAYIDAIPRTSTSNKVTKAALIAMPDPLTGVYDAEEKRWR